MKFWVVLIVLAISVNFSLAQGGSNYSAFGMGDVRRSVGAVYDALAGTSIALPTAHGVNTVNPALLGMENTTRIQVGYHFNQHVVSNGTDQLKQNHGKFDGLLALFSVDTAMGFGMSLGLLPYSSVNYAVRRNLKTDIDGSTITGYSNQLGEGGSSILQFGASVKLFNKVYFGLSAGGVFGIISHKDQVFATGNYYNVTSVQSYDLRGFLMRAGAYMPVNSWLNVGAIVSGGPNASVIQTQNAQGSTSGGAFYDTTQTTEYSRSLPFTYGLGANVALSNRSTLAADVEWSDFTDVNLGSPKDARLSTSFRTSLAYTRPGLRNPLLPYFDKWGYHAGASYQKLYVVYQGEPIDEVLGAVGFDFPLGGNAAVDVSLNAGFRTPRAANALTELVGKLTVTVSIGETWFRPFARD